MLTRTRTRLTDKINQMARHRKKTVKRQRIPAKKRRIIPKSCLHWQIHWNREISLLSMVSQSGRARPRRPNGIRPVPWYLPWKMRVSLLKMRSFARRLRVRASEQVRPVRRLSKSWYVSDILASTRKHRSSRRRILARWCMRSSQWLSLRFWIPRWLPPGKKDWTASRTEPWM